jgi:hypothetical protein
MANDNVYHFPRFECVDFNFHIEKMRPLGHYILANNRESIPVDLITWEDEFTRRLSFAKKHEDPWRVAETTVGEAWVSTVFLGIDRNIYRKGPPILFETMIFGGRLNKFQNRCSTWAEAEAMHNLVVAMLRGNLFEGVVK